MIGEIRTECYFAVLDKFKSKYPDAHFEIITRKASSVLSPAWDLLDIVKREHWSMEKYYPELGKQFQRDPDALALIKRLADIARSGKTVYVVCYEKDASVCHRTYVKMLIERELVKK